MSEFKTVSEMLEYEREVFEALGLPWPPPVERTDLKPFSIARNLSCGMVAQKVLPGNISAQVWPLTFGRARLSVGAPGYLEPSGYVEYW